MPQQITAALAGARKLEPLHHVVGQSICELHPMLPDHNVPVERLIRRAVEQVKLAATAGRALPSLVEYYWTYRAADPCWKVETIGSMQVSTARLSSWRVHFTC